MIPLVSICCQTYNHKDYIAQAIDSFLMQKTTFAFEILLRDDASNDGTREIVSYYSDKYPDIIIPLIYYENQYQKGIKPFSDNVKRARGKYIAICEGDDYWTDPLKLQKQVDFFEGNEGFGLVYTDFKVINQDGEIINNYPLLSSLRKNYSYGSVFFTLLSNGNFVPTLTVLFRKSIYDELHKNYINDPITKKGYVVDYWLWYHMAIHTKFGFLPEITAHYRKHPGGATSKSRIKEHIAKSGFIFYDILCYFDKNKSKKKLTTGEKAVIFRKTMTVMRNRHISAKQRLKIFRLALKYFSVKGLYALLSQKLSLS